MNEYEKASIREGSCQYCLYFRDAAVMPRGECRRNPPVLVGEPLNHWPTVEWGDWCGEFEDKS